MKNKKLALSVLSTAVVGSMASSAFALEPGIYIGGSADKHYSIAGFLNQLEQDQNFLDGVVNPNLSKVVYVDPSKKGVNLLEFIQGSEDDLNEALKNLTAADFDADTYTLENGQSWKASEDQDLQPAPAGELKVESVSAININGSEVNLEGASIAANSDITISFDEELDATTVNANNIYLTQDGVKQLATLSYDKTEKTVTIEAPATGFASGKAFVLNIGTGLKTATGKALSAAKTVNFSVAANPVVLTVNDGFADLTNGSVLDATNTDITVTFNKDMDVNTLNSTNVKLYNVTDGQYVAVSVAASGTNAVVLNGGGVTLDSNKKYRVIVKADVADLAGNKLGKEYTLDVFSSGSVSISNVSPSNGLTGVYNKITASGGNSAFRWLAQFNKDMDAATINSTNVTLVETATKAPVATTVSYEAGSRYVNIVPTADLKENTSYTVTLSDKIKTADGLAITKSTYTFTTGDFTKPLVASTTPANAATDVKLTDNIVLNFNEKMGGITLGTDVVLKNETDNATVNIAGWALVQSDDKKSFTITPDKSGANVLKPNKTYSLTLKNTIDDLAGNTLAADQKIMFNTVPAVAPAVEKVTVGSTTGTQLNADATGVAANAKLYFNFPVALNTSTVNATNVVLEKFNGTTWVAVTGAGAPTVAAVNSDKSIELDASTNNFTTDTQYRVRITTAVKDSFNTPLASEYVFGFLTGAKPTASAPKVVIGGTPNQDANLAVGVDRDTTVTLTIADDNGVLASSVNANNVYLKEAATGEKVAASVSYNAGTGATTITPDADLKAGTRYEIVVSGVKDAAGNTIADTKWSFTTVADGQPALLSVTPANDSFDVATDSNITIAFDSKMADPQTALANGDIVVTEVGVGPVADTAFEASLSADGKTVTIDPIYSLKANTVYKVTVKSTYEGANGVALGGSDTDVSFRTSSTYVKQKVTSVVHVEAGATGLEDDLLVITLSAPLDATADTDLDAAANFANYFTVANGTIAAADVASAVASGDTVTLTFGAIANGTVIADNFTTIAAQATIVDGNNLPFATTAVKVTKP